MNMGHEDETVTQRHYQKIPTERVYEIFDHFDDPEEESLEDKELMLRFNECELDRNSPEWHRARKLKQRRDERKHGGGGRLGGQESGCGAAR